MALFSFRHSVKSFSSKVNGAERAAQQGQTLAHLRYISRPSAARIVERVRVLANDPETALTAEAEAIRKKGRVAERFIVALPVEATAEQRVTLARAFAERLTVGKAGYVFAIHDQNGNDRRNPHFHLVAFDAYERTGGRGRPRSVLGMARKGAVERTAKLWADIHNDLMAGWGYGEASSISHLSHAARGIDRIPTIHEGPGARACAAKGIDPTPKPEWRGIDGGHSRAEANALIKDINQLKEMHDVQQPERAGLGERNDADPSQRGEDRRAVGPHPARGRGPARTAPDAGPQVARDDGQARPAPPFLRGAGRAPDGPPAPASTEGTATGLPPFLASLRRAIRRRSVRRSFRALVMMRDTLRARLRPPQTEAVQMPESPIVATPPESGAEPRQRQRAEITLG